jgi:hypothetical protein
MKWVQYDKVTGMIDATNSEPGLEANLPPSVGQVQVADEIQPETHKINLETLQPEELPPEE